NIKAYLAFGLNNARCSHDAQRSRRVKAESQARAICCCACTHVSSLWLNFANGSIANSADSKAMDMPLPVSGGIIVMASPTEHSVCSTACCGRNEKPATEQNEFSSSDAWAMWA